MQYQTIYIDSNCTYSILCFGANYTKLNIFFKVLQQHCTHHHLHPLCALSHSARYTSRDRQPASLISTFLTIFFMIGHGVKFSIFQILISIHYPLFHYHYNVAPSLSGSDWWYKMLQRSALCIVPSPRNSMAFGYSHVPQILPASRPYLS